MSGTHVAITFGVVIEDLWEHPTPALAELGDDVDRTDYVQHALEQHMATAGQRFIAEHPDWFRTGMA